MEEYGPSDQKFWGNLREELRGNVKQTSLVGKIGDVRVNHLADPSLSG